MADAIMLDVQGREVRLSSPGKEYFPGITKQQVAEYVMTVGEGMLSALRDRPTTMERWPGGFKADSPVARSRHRELVEGGARGANFRRLQLDGP